MVVYGGPEETHELAVSDGGNATLAEGEDVTIQEVGGATVLNWETSSTRRVVDLEGGLSIYILGTVSIQLLLCWTNKDTDRNAAYNYWVLKIPNDDGLFAPSLNASAVIVKAGYLMRNATTSGDTLSLVGDFNATTEIEVIGGAPAGLSTLNINGQSTDFTQDTNSVVHATVAFDVPNFDVPSLSSLTWKYIDTLPEIQPGYDDSEWPDADLLETYNTVVQQSTPVSLVGSDYGFSYGILLFRGHFVANGDESTFSVQTQGGSAFGSSVWFNSTYLGSFQGYDAAASGSATYALPDDLTAGEEYVLTVVVDETGLDENYDAGADQMKQPRGILDYSLAGHDAADVSWKLTGNLGGEDYVDRVRGPLNEGGLWAERHGYHLPGAPLADWADSAGPGAGINASGVAWYAAELDLDLPAGWDIPLSFTFANASADAFRVQLYVNGWQFGKYINNIGPQSSYPVPQGIL